MKDRNPTPYIVISIIVVLIIGGYILIRMYTPKYAWNENLNYKNKEPYGTSMLYNLIKSSYSKDNFNEIKSNDIESYFKEHPNSDYIFVGSRFFIDSSNINCLIEHLENGNNAFIAATYNLEGFINTWLTDPATREISNWLSDSLASFFNTSFHDSTKNIINSVIADTVITKLKKVNTGTDSEFTFYYQFRKRTNTYGWHYFDSAFFDLAKDYSPQVLSTIGENKPNYVSLKIGKGNLFLHCTPIFFSNYHLLEKETFTYLQNIWNPINSNKILWDNYSFIYYNKTLNPQLKESPLRFILKHKSLRWAWYTTLVLVLLFLTIQSKRKQNIIPLERRKKNNTLDYAKAIGSLYFQAKNHRIIVDEMLAQLYSFIRARYNIKVGKEKELILPRLSKSSGIKEQTLSDLFRYEIKLKYDENASSEELYKLYYLVDYFYKNCN